jgi:predicted XRE-type DNA-binding protein
MKKIIPISEVQRNNRVKELMKNKLKQKEQVELTEEQIKEIKDFMSKGCSRQDATRLVLELSNIGKESSNILNNWNTGGFVNEEKYKQPIKHKLY